MAKKDTQLPASFPLKEKKGTVITPEDLVIGSKETGPKQLHPVYAALLAERLQFDGDAPELRTGPMPPGTNPAPSVKTSSRSVVAIGAQLERASQEIKERFLEAEQKALESSGGELVPIKDIEPEGYKTGMLPAPLKAPNVSLTSLTAAERKAYAWKAISSTQGRRSVIGVIRELIEGTNSYEENPSEEFSSFEWTYNMSSEDTIQGAFNFIDSCAGYFKHCLEQNKGKSFTLHTIDRIPDRIVGWELRLYG